MKRLAIVIALLAGCTSGDEYARILDPWARCVPLKLEVKDGTHEVFYCWVKGAPMVCQGLYCSAPPDPPPVCAEAP